MPNAPFCEVLRSQTWERDSKNVVDIIPAQASEQHKTLVHVSKLSFQDYLLNINTGTYRCTNEYLNSHETNIKTVLYLKSESE